MTLIRTLRDATFYGKTITQVETDSAGGLKLVIDDAEVGETDKKSLRVSQTELKTLLALFGISAQASTTQDGIVEKATAAENNAGTATGSTGAPLFTSTDDIKALTKPDNFSLNSNLSTSDFRYYSGSTTFFDESFNLGTIDSVLIQTRLPDSGTRTTRANVAALNAYTETLGSDFVVEITITPDPAFNGNSGYNLKSKDVL